MDDPRRWIPYCGEAPGPEVWLSRWNLDPALVCLLVLLAVAVWLPSMRALAPSRLRSLRCALALAAVLYLSPLCALSSTFFTLRVVHHMALILVIAPLMAHGLAHWRPRITAPLWLSTALASGVFWTWHAPAPYAAAMSSNAVFALMQFSILASASIFWMAVRRAEPATAIAAILAATVQMGLLGALITFASRPMYEPHFASTLSWGVSPLEDQQLAGITMWAPGSVAYLAAAIWIGWRWMRVERARSLQVNAA